MFPRLSKDVVPLLISCIFLVVFNVITTALFPAIGFERLRIPFYVLIILFMGFKLDTPFLGAFIFIVMYVHSFFTVEGWEIGTISGILTCSSIARLRNIIHLSGAGFVMGTVFVFQVVWFLISSVLFFVKLNSWSYLIDKFFIFIPESLILSVLSPLLFHLLDKIWWFAPDYILEESK